MRFILLILLSSFLSCSQGSAEELVRINFGAEGLTGLTSDTSLNSDENRKMKEIYFSMEQNNTSTTTSQESYEANMSAALAKAANIGLSSALAKLALLEATSQLSAKELDALLERTAATADYDPKESQNDIPWIRSFLLSYSSICAENKYSLAKVELLKKILSDRNYKLERAVVVENNNGI